MAHNQLGTFLRQFRRLLGSRTPLALSDGTLLERFVAQQDKAAFASLLERLQRREAPACGAS